jgi:protein-disulfide isomerase
MRSILAAVTTAFLCSTVSAQLVNDDASLKRYAEKVLPRCPGGALTLQRLDQGPANFSTYGVTLRSTDEYCGTQKYLLFSPRTQQVLIGSVLPLPADNRPAHVRVTEETSRLLKTQLTTSIAPFPLPDGIKAVTLTRTTPYGNFAYHGFIDQSERFLIVGSRGNLQSDPAKDLRTTLGTSAGMRRGTATAKLEVIELSDFQCPTCARAHEQIEPLIKANLSKMNFIRIDLPLFEHHEWALPAAAAARAIQKVAPAKYWEYTDYVFKNQENIGKQNFDKFIKDYAEDHDIDWKAMEPIYKSKTERQAILDTVSRAFDLGINSTPTFIINGQIMGFGPEGTFTVGSLKAAIAAATPAKKPAGKKK